MSEAEQIVIESELAGVEFVIHRGACFSYAHRPLPLHTEVTLLLLAEEVKRELISRRGADPEALLDLWCTDEFLRCQFDRIVDFDDFATAQGMRILQNSL